MILDLMAWAPNRESFWQGMIANGFATESEDGYTAIPDVLIDEIGPIDRRTYDEQGNLTGGEEVAGHHVNLRVYGALADQVTAGMPTEGTIFERTRLLQMVPGLTWEPTGEGVPAGYVGPHGVKLYDPATVETPWRVWA